MDLMWDVYVSVTGKWKREGKTKNWGYHTIVTAKSYHTKWIKTVGIEMC